jgi:hypothetical protein
MRIFDYAVVSNWDSRLETLAEMAEPERWTYLHVPDDSPLPVLDSYIKYTFRRVFDQNKVIDSFSGQLACFNSGLLTPGQEEIFGIFSVSQNFRSTERVSPQNKKWYLTSWARSGDRVLTDFMELPKLAS